MPQIGQIVYDSGDWLEPVKEITVTEKNVSMIRRFWNKLYFNNRIAAEKKNAIAKAEYTKCTFAYLG